MREVNLTQGPIMGRLVRFSLPMIAGNMLQQVYNLVDTLVVGRGIGANALAAVGSAYTLMTFLTSILIGLCMTMAQETQRSCGRICFCHSGSFLESPC